MIKKLLFSSFLLLFFATPVSAQVVINEFSSFNYPGDWVEIYNYSPDTVDLSNYRVRDSTSTQKIDLSGQLSSKSFATFGMSDYLNKEGDVLRLFHLTAGLEDPTPIMVICYGKEVNKPICTETYSIQVSCYSESSEQSIGSYPSDGGHLFERFTNYTYNSTNETALLTPCPIPTLEPTATLTPTPKPTNTPTPTPTPKPTSSKTPTPKITASTPSKTEETPNLFADNTKNANKDENAAVLGEKDIKNGKIPYQAVILILIGVLMLIFSFLKLIKKKGT